MTTPKVERQAQLLAAAGDAPFRFGRQTLHLGDCRDWLRDAARESIHAVVTDPPYGLHEYQPGELAKLRRGRGGVWRLPPAFDGAQRQPLPRFTVHSTSDRRLLHGFFCEWAELLLPVLRPGGHALIASNPLMSPLVPAAMEQAGFERRGEIVRLVRTLRGGDRPKGAHEEFANVSTMPRSCWEPWGLYRRPLSEPTVAANLRRWGVGGLRRLSDDTPFLDVIESGKTPAAERAVACHPTAKPQAFLRQIIRASLPGGDGVVLDPFAGSGTTLAAAEALGAPGIGVEIDREYWQVAQAAIPALARLQGGSH